MSRMPGTVASSESFTRDAFTARSVISRKQHQMSSGSKEGLQGAITLRAKSGGGTQAGTRNQFFPSLQALQILHPLMDVLRQRLRFVGIADATEERIEELEKGATHRVDKKDAFLKMTARIEFFTSWQ